MPGDSTISILQRMIDPDQGFFSPAAAEAVLQMRLADTDQRRMQELAEKSSEGTLSGQEAAEYDSYIAAADFLSLWKSKARRSLKAHPSAA